MITLIYKLRIIVYVVNNYSFHDNVFLKRFKATLLNRIAFVLRMLINRDD